MTNQSIFQSPDLVPDQVVGAGSQTNVTEPPISVSLVTPDPPEYPYLLQLGSLQTGKLKTLRAVPVTIDRGEDCFTATWSEIDEFGYGKNAAEALHDLCRSLASLYRSLKHDEPYLGEDLRRVWSKMQQHFVPTHESA